MPISKALRFEIFRRDLFTCRYCGRGAPDVELHIDHVEPTSLGGSDKPENLVTACADCNSGKSGRSLNDETVNDIAVTNDEWNEAKARVIERRRARNKLKNEVRIWFLEYWPSPLLEDVPFDWAESLVRYYEKGLDWDDIGTLAMVTLNSGKHFTNANRFLYLFGCCKNRIAEIELEASREMRGDIHA